MKHLLPFILALCLFSCSEDEDPRLDFTGSYRETIVQNFQVNGEISQYTESGRLSIQNADSDQEILLHTNGGTMVAIVEGSTFTIPEQRITQHTGEYSYVFKCSGSGRIVNGQLTYTLYMEEVSSSLIIEIDATAHRDNSIRASRADRE